MNHPIQASVCFVNNGAVDIYSLIEASKMSTKAKSEDVMINWLHFSWLPDGPWACDKQMKLIACILRWVVTHWGLKNMANILQMTF